MNEDYENNLAILKMTYNKLRKLNEYLYITDTIKNSNRFYIKTTTKKIINIIIGKVLEERVVTKQNITDVPSYNDGIEVSYFTKFVFAKHGKVVKL